MRYVGDPSARNEAVVLEHLEPSLPLRCYRILFRYPDDDQLQEARMSVVYCLRKYQPRRAPFPFIVQFFIQKGLYRAYSNVVRLPENAKTLASKMKKALALWEIDFGGVPDDDWLIKQLRITDEKLEEMRTWATTTLPHFDDEDILAADDPAFETVVTCADVTVALKSLAVDDALLGQLAHMHFIEGKSPASIAFKLKLDTEAVWNLLDDAGEFLRGELHDYGS